MDKLNEVIYRSDFFPSDDRKFWNRESSKGVDVLGIHLQISVQCFTGSLMDFWHALVAYSCEQRLAASLDCFHEELLTYLFIEDFLRISYIYILTSALQTCSTQLRLTIVRRPKWETGNWYPNGLSLWRNIQSWAVSRLKGDLRVVSGLPRGPQ